MGRCPHSVILLFSYLLLLFSIMAESNGALEKLSLHQFENGADLSQHKEIADVKASSLGPPTFAGVDENAVLRKMDIRLIPMLSMLYLLAFLDRGNIGNAKIEGLVDDLHMTGPQYNWTCMNLFLCSMVGFCKKHTDISLLISNCLLLYLLCLRIAEQPASKEAQTVEMAAIDYGRLGDCHGMQLHAFRELSTNAYNNGIFRIDFDGSCPQLQWTARNSSLFGCCRYVER